MARFATDKQAAENLATALQDIPDIYLDCRQYKHAWTVTEEFIPFTVKGSRVTHLRTSLECLRGCGVISYEVYTVTVARGLERIRRSTSYANAPGYQLHGMPRGVKPLQMLQEERFRRHQEKSRHLRRVK
jgi:hypothetical protein